MLGLQSTCGEREHEGQIENLSRSVGPKDGGYCMH
jgi:hypothetical protein